MASSNRHWPSMFKSKPCNSPHQWHHDINPSLCHRSSPYPAVGRGGGVGGGGCEERSPEPKPRWNPRPEQIRILESIFNSGMVNPPRDEIRRIRTLLQEYGQVGDANVFYWFQNRKSRTKHKLRHSNKKQQTPNSTPIPTASAPVPASPSFPLHGSPNAVVSNQLTMDYFLPEVQYPPVGATGSRVSSDVLTFLEQHDQTAGGYSMMSETKKEKMMMSYATVDSTPNIATTTTTDSLFVTPSPSTSLTAPTINQSHLGLGESGALLCPAQTKLTVFINDVAFEVAGGPFNVRQSFGGDAVLLQSTGHPVVTDEWGVTLQSLQHGAFYYLVRTLAPPLCMRDVSSSDDIVLHHELPC